MTPSEWKYTEVLPDASPEDMPPGAAPSGCHGEPVLRIDHRLLADLRAGWQAVGAQAESRNQIEYLRQRLWDAEEYIEDLRQAVVKDVALLGLYRSAVMFGMGLIEQSCTDGDPVAETDKARLWADVTRADTLMLDLVDLIPAPTE